MDPEVTTAVNAGIETLVGGVQGFVLDNLDTVLTLGAVLIGIPAVWGFARKFIH